MTAIESKNQVIPATSIEPWLSLQDAEKAADFYKSAFGAVETYRMESPDGIVVKLSVDGAGFWVSGGLPGSGESDKQPPVGDAVRMILTVSNPDDLFARALNAGASLVFPVSEEYGWRLGRLADPFGFHWEIGHPL